MAVIQIYRMTVLFSLCQALHSAVSQCTSGGSEMSISGWKLQRHTYKRIMAKTALECALACRQELICQSINFVHAEGLCELNDRTKEAAPQDFVPDRDTSYFKRVLKRVPVGAIPELPGETCKRIKASEEEAVSGKYWLTMVKPGMSVLAYCDMNTEDVDECTASSPVCPSKTTCHNTLGSFYCTCVPGFSGDGEICQDINECDASPSPCHQNAVCINNEGSFECSCNAGYTGDGITCNDLDECNASPYPCDVNASCHNLAGSYRCFCNLGFTGDGMTCQATKPSCHQILLEYPGMQQGVYQVHVGSPRGRSFEVYCHMTVDGKGWTLAATFSNNDNKTWMRDDGHWWYDRQVASGTTTDPSVNADMISPAFWLVSGSELKITRSDDPGHTPLLQTTGNCLAGQSLRSKITGFGDFRNGKVWSSDRCLGNCTAQYGGQYNSTSGFEQAECSGSIQRSNKIGFWCDWGGGDGAVLMIGGGGNECARADHGIGITETGAASFVDYGTSETEYDFGYDAVTGKAPAQSYSLNLWIR